MSSRLLYTFGGTSRWYEYVCALERMIIARCALYFAHHVCVKGEGEMERAKSRCERYGRDGDGREVGTRQRKTGLRRGIRRSS